MVFLKGQHYNTDAKLHKLSNKHVGINIKEIHMFGLGTTELIIILVLVLIVFGAGKLPKVAGSLGKGLRNFKDGMDPNLIDDEDQPIKSNNDV